MTNRQKEIESLRARISKLEQLHEQEAKEKQALEDTRQSISNILEEAGLSFESYIRFNYKAVRRVITKIEKEQAKSTTQVDNKPVTKKAVTKRRKRPTKAKATIKIPAGKYSNIPSEPETVFEVKEKGPRPKALKNYAEEVGLEKFFDQCRVD